MTRSSRACGQADQDGTLQMGDTVVAIDGKPTHNMEDVKRAVISAETASLRLAVLRKPVYVVRRERAFMNMPDPQAADDDDSWPEYELTLFSNRQLTFEKLSPPQYTVPDSPPAHQCANRPPGDTPEPAWNSHSRVRRS